MNEKMLVEWSSEARDDLSQHVDFLRQRSNTAALRALSVIFAAADQLVDFPESGRVYRRDPLRRELLVSFGASGYSLLYEIETIKSASLASSTSVKPATEPNSARLIAS